MHVRTSKRAVPAQYWAAMQLRIGGGDDDDDAVVVPSSRSFSSHAPKWTFQATDHIILRGWQGSFLVAGYDFPRKKR